MIGPDKSADLVRKRRDRADRRLERRRQLQQCRVAGVARPTLDAADLTEVGVRPLGQLLLADARFLPQPPDRLAECGVVRRAGWAATARRHPPRPSRFGNLAVRAFMP